MVVVVVVVAVMVMANFGHWSLPLKCSALSRRVQRRARAGNNTECYTSSHSQITAALVEWRETSRLDLTFLEVIVVHCLPFLSVFGRCFFSSYRRVQSLPTSRLLSIDGCCCCFFIDQQQWLSRRRRKETQIQIHCPPLSTYVKVILGGDSVPVKGGLVWANKVTTKKYKLLMAMVIALVVVVVVFIWRMCCDHHHHIKFGVCICFRFDWPFP